MKSAAHKILETHQLRKPPVKLRPFTKGCCGERKEVTVNRNPKEPEKLINLWRKIKPVLLQTVQEKEIVATIF